MSRVLSRPLTPREWPEDGRGEQERRARKRVDKKIEDCKKRELKNDVVIRRTREKVSEDWGIYVRDRNADQFGNHFDQFFDRYAKRQIGQ